MQTFGKPTMQKIAHFEADLADKIKIQVEQCLNCQPQYNLKAGSPQLHQVEDLCSIYYAHIAQ